MKVRRGLLRAGNDRKQIVQHLAVDQFAELPTRKREALAMAKANDHLMGPWHRRKNDEYGRWDARCTDCGLVVTVAVEVPPNLSLLYGAATTKPCHDDVAGFPDHDTNWSATELEAR